MTEGIFIMNARIASAAVAIALLGSSAAAFAQQDPAVSRASVQAQVAQARASGELGQIYGYGYTAPAFVSTQSREAVKAEAERALAAGEVTVGDEYPAQPAIASSVSRAAVKANVRSSIRNGAQLDGADRG
jgi:hypothetical protein